MKRLIICCDGTWNRADQTHDGVPCPTNVIRIAYRIAKRDPRDPAIAQLLLYDQGVGTGNTVDRYTGGAFGKGLEDNIFDAYRFLISNYEAGDEIYLFGFSRGAFTARSLGGMIRNCGILKRTSVDRYLEALKLYHARDSGPSDSVALEFKTEHSITGADDVPIRFIGVWDTVGALGIPLRGLRWLTRKEYQFHDVQLSSRVARAAHAVSIDERRAPFAPTLFFQSQKAREAGQTVEQRWFSGVHSDVGGGYPEHGLSDITLEWMMGRAEAAGLAFDGDVRKKLVTAPDLKAQVHRSKKGLYRVTKGIDRPIGMRPKDPKDPNGPQEPDDTQSVDEHVLERWDEDPDYRPPQLREYFRRTGDSRASA